MPRSVVALIISNYSILLYFRAKYIEDMTRVRWREDTNFMFEWQERKIRHSVPGCSSRVDSTSVLVPDETLSVFFYKNHFFL